jgi:uncharacterized repeat protein (TIGR01451 family)
LFVALCGLALVLLIYPATTMATVSPSNPINAAWRRAQASGVYSFSTTIVETTHPAPTVANVGRGSREERIYLEGETNLPERQLRMTLWRNSGNLMTKRDGVEVRVEGDQAFGRQVSGVGMDDIPGIDDIPWQEIDADASFFAPGNDAMAYLAGARNVREVGREAYEGEEHEGAPYSLLPPSYSRYAFDLNGPDVADYIRDQLEAHLREEGELPTGLHLDTPEHFRDAIGDGEVWIDGDGLPLRLTLHIQYPQQRNGERVEAEIQTDFSDFDRRAVASAARPLGRVSRALDLPATSQEASLLGQRLALTLSTLSLLGFLVIKRRSKVVYAALVLAIVGSMVVTPLLQSQQAHAFSQKQAAQREELERREDEERAAEELRDALYGSDWDAHADPLGTGVGSKEYGVGDAARIASSLQADNDDPDPESDDDGDGLTYAQEERLGTEPDDKDTDGDGITDNAEVKGFEYNNQWWYLDPLTPDTNDDGRLDTLECEDKAVKEGELSPDGRYDACQDTDGDGAPDPFDRDDDGDGVPDRVDISPSRVEGSDEAGSPFDGEHPLLLQVDGLQPDEPAFVDFQIRPRDEERLWYAFNVLDWPSGDEAGQLKRKSGNDSTFEDVAVGDEPVAANAGNGDMRLIPMLEIEMTGENVPLKFTDPAIEVAFVGGITGTLHFRQVDGDVEMEASIDAAGSYSATIYDDTCDSLDDELHSFTGLSDGDTRTLSDEKLTRLANGERSVVLSDGAHDVCVNMGNVINGAYEDRMVDREPLDPYGISVREKDHDETLLAYVPLNVLADETGEDRVAFSARMHYWPTADEWGDTQKVRMTWVVQMLTDHPCTDVEEDAGICSGDEWVLDSRRIVRAYDEAWTLTGLAVREDHGLQVAIIAEDPAEEASEEDRRYDDWLWALAWGLQDTFLIGMDCEPLDGDACGGDGERDVTIDTIHARFDNRSNTGTSDEERWGIPITATQVTTYAYEHIDFVSHVMMTETRKILDDTFSIYVDDGSDAPTLLFAQESHYRSANLGDVAASDVVTSQLTIRLDPEESKEEVVTSLSWAPYRRQDGEWRTYPIDEYWDKMEVRFEDAFDEYRDDPDFEDIRDGQVMVAQMSYLTLFNGRSVLVEMGDEIVGNLDAGQTNAELAAWREEVSDGGGGVARVTKSVATNISTLVKGRRKTAESIRNLYKELKAARGTIKGYGGYRGYVEGRISALKKDRKKATRMAVATLVLIGLSYMAAHTGTEWLTHGIRGVFALMAASDAITAATTLYKAARGSAAAAYKLSQATKSVFSKLGCVGILVSIAVAWGLFVHQVVSSDVDPASLAFTYALAQTVASIIAAVILLTIAAIPVVGQILAAVIGLFDAVVLLICGALESDNPICRGISGWVAVAVAWVIFSQSIMVDFDDQDRLSIHEFSQDFLDASQGMSVGNSLVMEATVRNDIRLIDWADTNYNWMAGLYWWQMNNDNLRSSTFRYDLDARARSHHEGLSRYGIRQHEWSPESDSAGSYVYYDDESTTSPLTEAGINRRLPLYLNESYAVPTQECWLLPCFLFVPVIPVCYVRTHKDSSNLNLGQNMRFDVFPATFDGFYDLTEKEGGHALAWSQDSSPAFPRLQDADGDGLRVKVAGGSDPDDLEWDTDGDGLSDYHETIIGSDPDDWDSDDDGLNDYDEVILETDPNRQDTDYDGLTDAEEVEGWSFVYDFDADGTPLSTWVTSDPLLIDGDDDSLSDFQEKTYGFHPRVVSDPSLLSFESEVSEPDAPRLLLRLDETDDATTFSDESGFLNNGTCTETHCPAAGHYGKYGNAPHFDGADDYVTVDGLSSHLTGGVISFGAWVYADGGMTEDGAIVAFNPDGDGNRHLLMYDPDDDRFYYHDPETEDVYSSSTFDSGAWHHVFVVIDADDDGRLYVDGAEEATFATAVRPAGHDRFSIGQEWDDGTASNFFLGLIDEVLVFPRALTQSEVEEQAAGRYNPDDLRVTAGDHLRYEAAVTNELFNRYAQGLLSTDFPAAFEELPPQDFVLQPRESITLTGEVDVGAAPSGIYTLTQEADALITDWQEASDFAELLYHFSDDDTLLDDNSGAQPPRHGACESGHCPSLVDGRHGNGAAFDGNDAGDGSPDYVTADAVCDALTGRALSFGAWVYPESGMADDGAIMAFNPAGDGNRHLLMYDPDDEKFYYHDREAGNPHTTSTFDPGAWYHVMVVIFEGHTDNGYLYVNGVEEARFSTSIRPKEDDRFSLGQEWDGGATSNFFAGRLDEVVVFSRALYEDEVQAQFNSPMARFPFDEESGAQVFQDASGFENDATCQGDDRCPAAGEPGVIGQSLRFDGDDYVDVPDVDALAVYTGPFTLSAWVYPEGEPALSSCPFVAEYFSNNPYTGREDTERRCEGYPIDHDWGEDGWGQGYYRREDFEVHWTGTFYFREGDHTFRFTTDDGMRAWLGDIQLLDAWHEQGETTYEVVQHVDEGFHTVRVEYFEWAGSAVAQVSWTPDPLPQPQGILGADDYPAIQRVGNRLRLVLNDDTAFLTENEVLSPEAWNHVSASFDRDSNTWFLYVDGVEVDQFNVTGESPEAGTGFSVGRSATTATLDLDTVSVLAGGDTSSDNDYNLELRVELRLDDGGWQEVWADDDVAVEDYDLNVSRAFQHEAQINLYERDAVWRGVHDDDLGTHTVKAMDVSPFQSTTRYESDAGDKVDLLWRLPGDAHNVAAPFQGRIDEVAVHKKALSAEEVADAYEAGTVVLRLPLDDAPGSSEFVEALGQQNGSCSSAATCPTAGVPGRDEMALLFDGDDDVVTVSDVDTEDVRELTVAAWVRLKALPGGIMRFVTVGDEKAVIRYDDGQLDFYVSTIGVPNPVIHHVRHTPAWVADRWYHVAGTYDGDRLRLYLDGVEVGSRAVGGDLMGGDTIRLSSGSEPLDGYLDDVRVYRRALSGGRVRDLYDAAPEMALLLDETTGATQFADFTGNGHHGSCGGDACPDAGTPGQIGLSANFDGQDDVIEVDHDEALNPGDEMTLALWVKLTDTDPDQKLVGKSTIGDGFVLGITDGQLYPEIWDTSGNRYSAGWGRVNAGYWTHLALTWETGGDMVGYINGNEAGRISAGDAPIETNVNPLRVGAAPWDGSSYHANGRLDHVTLHTRALSPREIRAMFRLQAKWIEERQHTEITLDDDDPTSTLESADDYRPNRDAVLQVHAEDATTSVTLVEMEVSTDGGTTTTWSAAPPCEDSEEAAWCPTFEPTIGEGRYQLQFRATDSVGNRESPTTTYTTLVDDTPPTVTTDVAEGEILDPARQPDDTWLVHLSGTVSDPLIAGSAGSGVAALAVDLRAIDAPQGGAGTVEEAEGNRVRATVDGTAWQADYPLLSADPTGTYTLTAVAVDEVGNRTTVVTLVTLGVDAAPPEASLDDVTAQTGVTGTITTTLTLTGLVTETRIVSAGISHLEVGFVPGELTYVPTYTVALYRFDEASGATTFADASNRELAATCAGDACPSAGHPGAVNQAVHFDGGDVLTVTQGQGFAKPLPQRDMSVVAWIDVTEYAAPEGYVSAIQDNGGFEKGWAIGQQDVGEREFFFALSSEGADDGDGALTYLKSTGLGPHGGWYHVAATYDGTTMKLYVNGELRAEDASSQSGDINYPDSGWFAIGAFKDDDQTDGHHGYLDEVAVFDRVLTPGQIRALYGAGEGGSGEDVRPWDDATLSSAGEGVLEATWAYTMPAVFDGLYEIHIRPEDVYGNRAPSDEWSVWTGVIDNAPPEVDLQVVEKKEEIAGVAGKPIFNVTTTYRCWARDFNLVYTSTQDADLSFQCPCQEVAPNSTVVTDTFYHQASLWYHDTFTDTARLHEHTESCTVLGLQPATGYMRACDAYGNCDGTQDQEAEQLIEGIGSVYGTILTPTHKATITSTGTATITGKAYANNGISTVTVKDGVNVIGTPVSLSCDPPVTVTQWTQPWTPAAGSHQLSSVTTPCVGSAFSEPSHEVTVDATPPQVTIAPLSLNRDHRLSYGRVALAGQALDGVLGSGVTRAEVSVDGGAWSEASLQGNAWSWGWYLGEEPDGARYTVSARATDRAGWTTRVTETVTVDLDVPNPITLTLTADGQAIPAGRTVPTVPVTLNLSWEASEPPEKLSRYDVLWTVRTATQTVQVPDVVWPTQPLLSTYNAVFGAQQVEPQVTSVFTDGNTQVDDYGPVVVDAPRTPDYVPLPTHGNVYRGWMESGCTALGVDRRVAENAQGGAALDDPQRIYATWDSEALRLAWTGANWDYDGDLFIYLKTDPYSAPITSAYNPFGATQDVEVNLPGANAFVWVQDSELAELYAWDDAAGGLAHTNLDATQYRFDAGLDGGLTDLRLPFDMLGIDDPATSPLVLYAFATDEEEMHLWATMPHQNPVNSERVVDTDLFAGAQQAMDWLHVYAWTNLGPGTCPNDPLFGITPAHADTDLHFDLSATPVGSTYGLMSSDLFWMTDLLTDTNRAADLSQGFDFMDVRHPPVAEGETISYTLSYANHGTYTATQVMARATGLYGLELTGAVSDVVTITIGTVPPGATGSVTFTGDVDANGGYADCMAEAGGSGSCEDYRDWAVMGALVYDAVHGTTGTPLDWLWADHRVDSEPPEFLGILEPGSVIGVGENVFEGYAFDASGVPQVTLEAEPPAGGSYQTVCTDDAPFDGVWSCSWDTGAASDGDLYEVRLRATDGYGEPSDWTPWRTYVVDETPPTVTLSAETMSTYSDTVLSQNTASFSGRVGDERGVAEAMVCLDGGCEEAELSVSGASSYVYDHDAGSPDAIGACGGAELSVTFDVTETFDVGAVSLGLNIDHPQRDTLSVTLASPGSVLVDVVEPPEGTPSEYQNLDVFLEDASPGDLHEARADDDTGLPYYDRPAHPDDPLQPLRGEGAAGAWTLTICDAGGDDRGSYNRSQLVLEEQGATFRNGAWSYTESNLREQDDVTHTLEARGVDLAGNESGQAVSVTFRIDNVAPQLTISDTVDLFAVGLVPTATRVMTGASGDGGRVQQLYAMVRTPSGDLVSLQVGRDGDTWWLDLRPEEVGEYTIWVNAVDLAGNTTTQGPLSVTVVRLVAINDGPTALGETTTLTATVLGDGGYGFDWHLGDGTTLSDQPSSVDHVYPTAGSYTATVTATKGSRAFTATTAVVIEEAITGLHALNDGPTDVGTATGLTATVATGSAVAYAWDFGDGQPSASDDQPVVAHNYPAGVYTATVAAVNNVSAMTATTRVRVGSYADVAVTKAVSDPIPRAGATVVYTVGLTNEGPDGATGVVVSDTLPLGVTYVADEGGGAYDQGSGAWTVGALGAGQVATLHLTATVDAGLTAGTVVTNTARVIGSDQTDPDGSDNADHATIAAQHPDAVMVTVTPEDGGTLVYTDGEGRTIKVEVPAGAVSETVTLVLTPLDGPTHPTAPLFFAGQAFTLELYQDGVRQLGYVFGEPVLITIHYSDEDVAGIDEATLALDVWTGGAWEDAACDGYQRHPDENWLSVEICHLSQFALLGQGQPVPVGGSTLAMAPSTSLWQRTLVLMTVMLAVLALVVVLSGRRR